jgi:alkylation response protein AidB-like acyl-CoA dehydrogenase
MRTQHAPALDVARVRALRPDADDPAVRTAEWVRGALAAGLLDLPLPGRGSSEQRLRALLDVGSLDLDLARLVEAHADALAILADLDGTEAGDDRRLWGVWAADPPADRLTAVEVDGRWLVDGTKPWCSGAGTCDAALVTAHAPDGYRLFRVDLGGPGVRPVDGTWPGVALRGSDSRAVRFTRHPAVAVGGPGGYLDRPGFWHGAVGVAAVWLGGAAGVAGALATAHGRRPLNPHALAHAGAVDALLAAGWSLLRDAAEQCDRDPEDTEAVARRTAGRVRAVVERVATEVVDRVGRALGPAPLARDPEHARRVADLQLYLRQHHAERDLEEHGSAVLAEGRWPW